MPDAALLFAAGSAFPVAEDMRHAASRWRSAGKPIGPGIGSPVAIHGSFFDGGRAGGTGAGRDHRPVACGYASAPVARRIPRHLLRMPVAVIGLGMIAILFRRLIQGA